MNFGLDVIDVIDNVHSHARVLANLMGLGPGEANSYSRGAGLQVRVRQS